MDKDYLNEISQNLSNFVQAIVDLKGEDSCDVFANKETFQLEFKNLDRTEEDKKLQLKIDILERILEILRIEKKYLKSKLPIETFIQGRLEFINHKIRYIKPKKIERLGSGTKPISLQPKLLLYLLYRHNHNRETVYNIIDNFINLIWDNLDMIDFKKTQTGVLRCFTNTRFAAHTLRDYGLLLNTDKVAYKTWSLSLPGILVASKMMEVINWEVPPVAQDQYHFDLHPDIRNAFEELKTYDKFVKRLISVCRPNTKVFEVSAEGAKRSYSLLSDYWCYLRNSSIPANERKKRSIAKLKQINQDQEIKKFFKEFCLCLKIGDALNIK